MHSFKCVLVGDGEMENCKKGLSRGFATEAIHAGQNPSNWDSMCVVAPMVSSVTFQQYAPADFKKYEYGRSGNPTREVLELILARLDNGTYGLCFSSGLGVITAICSMFKSGGHIICGQELYGGTNILFNKVFTQLGLEVSMVDVCDLGAIKEAIKPNTKLIWVEALTNPTLKLTDIPSVAEIAHQHDIVFGVDSTFTTPYFQRPLDQGADIVMHSVTKYINGHSDVTMGVAITNNPILYDKLKFLQNAMGVVPAPFDCYQVIRSVKTLALRMEQHMKNSIEIVKYLESHPKVEKVIHPSLESHPQYSLYQKLCSGFSGMVSFYLKGNLEDSKKFLQALKLFTLAASLGDVESLANLPMLMTPAPVSKDGVTRSIIPDNLIRLSVGIEDSKDLIADLKQALDD